MVFSISQPLKINMKASHKGLFVPTSKKQPDRNKTSCDGYSFKNGALGISDPAYFQRGDRRRLLGQFYGAFLVIVAVVLVFCLDFLKL